MRERECRGLLEALRGMGPVAKDLRCGGGEILYPSGEGDGALYVLLEGVVRLFGYYVGHAGVKEATLRLLGPWELFGHPAFAGRLPRAASAEAVTDCAVVKVPRVFVKRVLGRPEAGLALATLLELELTEREELVECLLPRRTEVRLAKLLPILARKFGDDYEDGGPKIGIRLTHQDLAAMVASTRESVTAALNGLRSSGIVEVEAERIVLRDPGALDEISRR